MYCPAVYVDMNGEDGWVAKVWLSGGICSVSGSAEQFCQLAFNCACMLSLGIFHREYVCGASVVSLCCFHVHVPST